MRGTFFKAKIHRATARGFEPKVVLVDRQNKIVSTNVVEIAGPGRRVTS
jgi:aspartate 1-decarboxylase